MNEPYFIEVDNNGCERCGNDRTWCVIGPDGDAIGGVSYSSDSEASEIAELLNEAYYKGQKSVEVKA